LARVRDRWNIAGTWVGEYSYHPNHVFPSLPSATPFTLMARRGWFGHFTGVIQDDPANGVPEAASAGGFVKGLSVTFRKQYPEVYIRSGDRSVTLRDKLEAKYGITVSKHQAPTRWSSGTAASTCRNRKPSRELGEWSASRCISVAVETC
jgi:hypothetical protein